LQLFADHNFLSSPENSLGVRELQTHIYDRAAKSRAGTRHTRVLSSLPRGLPEDYEVFCLVYYPRFESLFVPQLLPSHHESSNVESC
jgi:hypothetical protein